MVGEFVTFLGSLAGVTLIVALTYFLGFRQAATIPSEDEARELFRLAPGGFDPAEIGLDANGAAAIARDSAGRVAVLVPHGNQFVFRLLAPGVAISNEGGQLKIPSLPGVNIDLGEDARGWAVTDIDGNSD